MKQVLITGGTGFFGKAMVTRLLLEGAERVCILSRSESKQAAMRREFHNDPRLRWMIGDVRDRLRVRRAMRHCDLVIHAAALKRIEVGHYNPGEMVQTNVIGTKHVVEEAEDAGIDCVVLSTDKAFEPVSAYGYSKALGESLALASGASVVRYGNVAGSTGSVIPTWRELIAGGAKRVPVTDPECTRFWMWAWEAVELVLETARTLPDEPAIPMLPAYRLGDLAEAMGVEMEIRGLPQHEKKHESMRQGESSAMARRMSVDELREALAHV